MYTTKQYSSPVSPAHFPGQKKGKEKNEKAAISLSTASAEGIDHIS